MFIKEIDPAKISKILQYSDRVGTTMDPVCIQAAITDHCFNKCLNCDHHLRDEKKIITGWDWIKFLERHPGIESVAYLGGDIMTHPDLNKIMEYHVRSKTAFGIVSCGYIRPTVDLHLLANVRWYRVSLDTVDPIVYEKCRGGISLQKILGSIDIALSAGIKVGLEITVSKHNKDLIGEVFEYAFEKFIPVEVHPCFGEEFDETTTRIIENYIYKFKANNLEFSFFCYSNFQFTKCVAPYYQIYIDTDGDIYPCCASSGDLQVDKMKTIMGNISDWEGFLKNRSTHKMKYKACANCCDNTTRINYVNENYDPVKNFF